MENNESLALAIAVILRRYLEVQNEEQRLKEEKAALQEKLAAHMTERHLTYWYPSLDGLPIRVRCQESTIVEYCEETLRERLGSRFTAILAPDIRKIKEQLSTLADYLMPVMDRIGSPSADKVRTAIEQGVVQKQEFAGAFKKSIKRFVSVSKIRPNG